MSNARDDWDDNADNAGLLLAKDSKRPSVISIDVSSPGFFVFVELELVLLPAAKRSKLLSFKSTSSAKSGTGAKNKNKMEFTIYKNELNVKINTTRFGTAMDGTTTQHTDVA